LAIAEKLPPSVRGLGVILTGLGDLFFVRGEVAKAEQYYRRALAVREQFFSGGIGVARSLNRLAITAQAQGDLGRADAYAARASNILDKLPPATLQEYPPLLTDAYIGLGEVYADLGD
jgi:tetratricopeptide (TPR) repeat protein